MQKLKLTVPVREEFVAEQQTASSPEAIAFPYSPPSSKAEPVDISPDVKWLRMPMPYALDHVNIYLVRVAGGWLIVDTGLDSSEARGIWEEVFSGPLGGEKVVGVYCTHYHVDHVGLAGYLAERWRVPLFMTYEEYFTLRGWPDLPKEVPWQHAEFFRRAGLPQELLPQTLVMFDFSREISPMPLSFVRLQDRGHLPLDEEWQVMVGRGHSPEHALLLSKARKILISGDQLLPSISTNVSVSVMNPEDDPLSHWLASLDRLATIPDDVLVLPGHGLPFRGARKRVKELQSHHRRRFQVILDSCTDNDLSAYELVKVLYPFSLSDFDLQLALGECLAHVRYLACRGRLEARLDGEGINRYRSVRGLRTANGGAGFCRG
ncbi:MBL fold metallo-hydrolase [Geobacter hydrogenophilus]|uniref:MBL fold metallo-hydrolase n=1 Tax=Geobacter hydrogenophilus TaxID=40983 RepID=A0A9W6LD30_9BACT|nr:MBL fold metallo-hydrolase [Geobacter hydrogenophilus]MBT0894486.1 MBL fold metallo-hydrolase [Geobacter hydrogenophilus]GLI39358.1 MBL fold metallo-hydrolase [Geobacter hydrogenophilus]